MVQIEGASIKEAMEFLLCVLLIGVLTDGASSVTNSTVKSTTIEYNDRNTVLEGFLYEPSGIPNGKRPAVLIYPAFWGPSDHEKQIANELAHLGYIVFIADVFGKGIRPKTRPEAYKNLGQYFQNREGLLRPRIMAAYNYIRLVPNVDTNKIAAIGYCFGGGCVLDLVRTNVNLAAGVSFHGVLLPIKDEDFSKLPPITTPLLICHGDADEEVNPSVPGFMKEMRARKADFQFVSYAKALHGFTMQKEPNGPVNVGYDARADRRSKAAMLDLFRETIGIPNKSSIVSRRKRVTRRRNMENMHSL